MVMWRCSAPLHMLGAAPREPTAGGRKRTDPLFCDFQPAGAVVGIVGGNGAGKTTLFRMIMGQDTPDSGEGRAVRASTVRCQIQTLLLTPLRSLQHYVAITSKRLYLSTHHAQPKVSKLAVMWVAVSRHYVA
jgi:ATPase subunit of ABC transporter with duplicated ATPase domains